MTDTKTTPDPSDADFLGDDPEWLKYMEDWKAGQDSAPKQD